MQQRFILTSSIFLSLLLFNSFLQAMNREGEQFPVNYHRPNNNGFDRSRTVKEFHNELLADGKGLSKDNDVAPCFIDNSGNMDFGRKLKEKEQKSEQNDQSMEAFYETNFKMLARVLEDREKEQNAGSFTPILRSEHLTGYKKLNSYLIKSLLRSCPADLKRQIHVLKNTHTYQVVSRKGPIKNKILLYGPPGTGKSSLAKAIADYCDLPRMFISSASLVDQYKNSGQQNLRKLFSMLMNYNGRCVLILDEFTGLTDKHNKKNDQDTGVNEALFSILDECSDYKNILFIATVNEIKKLPEQIKDRFRRNVYKIDLPDFKRRKQFIKKCFVKMYEGYEENFGEKELSLEGFVDEVSYTFELKPCDYVFFAKKTQGFSIRDLNDMAEEAVEYALERTYDSKFNIRTHYVFISKADFDKALKKICGLRKEMSKENYKGYKELLKEWYPIVMPALGIYLQYNMSQMSYNSQMALAKTFHAQQMLLQKTIASDQLKFSKNTSAEQLSHQTKSSIYNLISQIIFGCIHVGIAIWGKQNQG